MPLTVDKFGNGGHCSNNVILLKGNLKNHQIKKGEKIIFASVGAGMHINAMVYEH